MDRFKAMQVFVQIAEKGSLTAAARELGASTPAVVRSLAAYEAHLGARLFNRTTRRISLTEEGRQHLAHCRQVLAAVDEAESALRDESSTEPTGLLTITAPVLFGQMYVAPAVTRFVQRHPGVQCSLMLLDRVVNLLEEGIEVGVRIGALEDSGLVALPLGQTRRVVVAAPSYLRQHGTPRHPSELAEANCIRTMGGPVAWGPFQDQGKGLRLKVKGNLEFNHVWPAVQACVAGAGFGTFFSYQVEPCIRDKQLKIVLEDFEPPPRPISIVYPHARLLPARTRAFVDFVRAEVTQFRV